jgi:hypothetical protein
VTKRSRGRSTTRASRSARTPRGLREVARRRAAVPRPAAGLETRERVEAPAPGARPARRRRRAAEPGRAQGAARSGGARARGSSARRCASSRWAIGWRTPAASATGSPTGCAASAGIPATRRPSTREVRAAQPRQGAEPRPWARATARRAREGRPGLSDGGRGQAVRAVPAPRLPGPPRARPAAHQGPRALAQAPRRRGLRLEERLLSDRRNRLPLCPDCHYGHEYAPTAGSASLGAGVCVGVRPRAWHVGCRPPRRRLSRLVASGACRRPRRFGDYTRSEMAWLLGMDREEAIDFDAVPRDSLRQSEESMAGNAEETLFAIARWHDVHAARRAVTRDNVIREVMKLRAQALHRARDSGDGRPQPLDRPPALHRDARPAARASSASRSTRRASRAVPTCIACGQGDPRAARGRCTWSAGRAWAVASGQLTASSRRRGGRRAARSGYCRPPLAWSAAIGGAADVLTTQGTVLSHELRRDEDLSEDDGRVKAWTNDTTAAIEGRPPTWNEDLYARVVGSRREVEPEKQRGAAGASCRRVRVITPSLRVRVIAATTARRANNRGPLDANNSGRAFGRRWPWLSREDYELLKQLPPDAAASFLQLIRRQADEEKAFRVPLSCRTATWRRTSRPSRCWALACTGGGGARAAATGPRSRRERNE